MEKNELKIMTLNVQQFITSSAKILSNFLYNKIIQYNIDVLCLQEFITNKDFELPGYNCIITRQTTTNIENCIFIKNNLNCIRYGSYEYINNISEETRCFVYITLKNNNKKVTIVCTHLCGGKHDDTFFLNNENIREKQLEEILLFFNKKDIEIDIILGDFNSHENERIAKKSYTDYKLYNKLEKNDKKQFLKYSSSGHNFLKENGFENVYTTEEIGKTSLFGGTVDWIYKNNKNIINNINNINNINCLRYTDHNAIVYTYNY